MINVNNHDAKWSVMAHFVHKKLYSHSHENGFSRSAASSVSRSFLRPRETGVLPEEPLPPTPGRCNKWFLTWIFTNAMNAVQDQKDTTHTSTKWWWLWLLTESMDRYCEAVTVKNRRKITHGCYHISVQINKWRKINASPQQYSPIPTAVRCKYW